MGFSPRAERRIGRAVRRVESLPKNSVAPPRGTYNSIGPQLLLGYAASAITNASPGTVAVYRGVPGSESAAARAPILLTVYGHQLPDAFSIEEDDPVIIGWVNGFWQVLRDGGGGEGGGGGTQTQVIEATLTEDMGESSADEASADVDAYYSGSDPGSTVTLHDSQQVWTRILDGAKAKAIYDDVRDQFEIVWAQHSCKWCRFQLNGTFGHTDEHQEATVLAAWDGHGIAALTSEDPDYIHVYNIPDDSEGAGFYLFEGELDGTGLATYDPENNKWWVVNIECPVEPPS